MGATKLHSKLVFVVLATTTFDEFLLKAFNVWVPGGQGGPGQRGLCSPLPRFFGINRPDTLAKISIMNVPIKFEGKNSNGFDVR